MNSNIMHIETEAWKTEYVRYLFQDYDYDTTRLNEEAKKINFNDPFAKGFKMGWQWRGKP